MLVKLLILLWNCYCVRLFLIEKLCSIYNKCKLGVSVPASITPLPTHVASIHEETGHLPFMMKFGSSTLDFENMGIKKVPMELV